ncbi:MAG: hypothetical protein JXA66_07400 [Oligoflexia bacterium]|nr:hypothetical protein [Oligoflexia bacterium]
MPFRNYRTEFVPFKGFKQLSSLKLKQKNVNDELPEWDLGFLYKSWKDPKIFTDLAKAKKAATLFRGRYLQKVLKGKLGALPLLKAIREYESISRDAVIPYWYLYLVHSTMLDDQELLSFFGKAENIFSDINKKILFFESDLARTTNTYKKRVFKANALKEYHNFLNDLKKMKNHLLPQEQEELLVDKNINGNGAWKKFREIFEGKFMFVFRAPEDAVERAYTLSELVRVARKHEDYSTRYEAAELILKKYGSESYVFTFIYNSVIQDMIRIDKNRRGFSPLIRTRNLSNQLNDRQVNLLLDTVTEYYEVAQRYWKLKAIILRQDRIRSCDVYAPLVVHGARKQYTFTEALELIQKAMDGFSRSYGDLFENLYRCGLIDARLKESKRSGAYCAMIGADLPSVVFMNFTGRLNDVFTLAHEAGHWIHHVLMAENRTHISGSVPLTTAETASVFNEMLLASYILDNLGGKDKDPVLAFLMEKIDDMFATVFRQAAFSRFEQRVFRDSEDGPLTTEQFSDAFVGEYGKLFGTAVEMTPTFPYEWAYIPHFVNSPFYVYAYSFGELATIALYRKYMEKPEGFAARYMKFLASGSVFEPVKLYKSMGIDINSRKTWESGFEYLSTLVNRVEQLAAEAGRL